jgi:hypothetical protein
MDVQVTAIMPEQNDDGGGFRQICFYLPKLVASSKIIGYMTTGNL